MSSISPDFSVLGLSSNQFPDPYKNKHHEGQLIIVGSGRCVWDDLQHIHGPYDVMAVNDMIMHYPGPLKHAYSNDAKWLPKWVEARRPRYVMDWGKPIMHSCNEGAGFRWPMPGHGTSGLNAAYVGLGMGYDRIILCGIPMDNTGHYFDPPILKTNYDKGMRFWGNLKKIHPHVYSMSGKTRELLGSP